ncbi:MAG: hypothetical protein AAFX50_13020, partial [Acidobacteriota bacterium]
LFAGFTSFMSKRCWSHIFSMGVEGTLASSSMVAVLTGVVQQEEAQTAAILVPSGDVSSLDQPPSHH